MKRRMLHNLWILVLLCSLLLSGCVREEINEGDKLDPDEQTMILTEDNEDDMSWEAETSDPSAPASDDISSVWTILQEARDRMAGLSAIEENQLLYTKKDGSDESITLRLTMTDMDTDGFTVGAVGTVKTQGNVIPLEIYYKNGVMVRTSGGNSAKEEASKDQVLATVDFLLSIRRDLKEKDITSAKMLETADGFKTISLVFDGDISGLPTSGRGEILIDANGLIASEGYSFEATNKDGKAVSQSVECTLLAVNEAVKAIELPPEIK